MISTKPESYGSGRVVGAGSYVCRDCGYRVVLEALDEVPECPSCGGGGFRRASLFEPGPEGAIEQPTADQPIVSGEREPAEWLATAREECAEAGRYLAFRDGEEVHVSPIQEGWSRIGRSISADFRFDDPTVSRRHALIVRTPDDRMRVLDDRSLNGVFVNGERVEWSRLEDGDEIAVGRYRLHVLDVSAVKAEAQTVAK